MSTTPRADKRFGQHYLSDPRLLEKIVRQAGPLAEVSVAEIGPGPGGLTRAILAGGPASLLAVEIDPRFIPALAALADTTGGRMRLLQADATAVDLVALLPAPRAVIANLPYNVGTPLFTGWLARIARDPASLGTLVLMFQKEVAERIVAAPGSAHYGRLAVLSQWLCHATIAFDVPPGAFSPPPKVSSSVVVATPRARKLFDAEFADVERVLASAFGQRRKMLRGALKTLGPEAGTWLEQAGIDGERRAETLSLEEFGRLVAACTAARSAAQAG